MGLGVAGSIAAVGAAASVASAGAGIISSTNAAGQQTAAANNALGAQTAQTAFNNANQFPYIAGGQGALDTQQTQINGYDSALAPYQAALNAAVPKAMTEANLIQTPGYQFNLSQGLQAAQNSAAARGLGVSGAAMKGAATYATGLADNTYQNQFANQQTQYTDASNNMQNALAMNNQAFNQNASRIQVGENAAVGAGTVGQAGATNAGNISTGLGNGLAASSIAQGNALSGGANGISNAATNYGLMNALGAYGSSGSVYGNGLPSQATLNALSGQAVQNIANGAAGQ